MIAIRYSSNGTGVCNCGGTGCPDACPKGVVMENSPSVKKQPKKKKWGSVIQWPRGRRK